MTNVVMPPILSIPSDEIDQDVAFKVLNQDNLPISVVGETIIKPFGTDQKLKPNVIVLPTRRIPTNLEENKKKPFTKSSGNINQKENNKNLKKKYSNSHGNLNHQNSTSKPKVEDFKSHIDTKFAKTLDAKLRRLQQYDVKSNKKNVAIEEKIIIRKPFVTVVKKGTFLEPPPDIANLIGIRVEEHPEKREHKKLVYTYASQPQVLNRSPPKNVHLQKCNAAFMAARLAGSIVGIKTEDEVDDRFSKKKEDSNYANLMYERRVYRGSNFAQQHLPPWNPHFAYAKLLSRDDGDGESAAARAAEARRRALARRKAKNQTIRTSQLRLGSPPPVSGRRHEKIQTEDYLEELFVNPPVSDMCTQTDLFLERPVSPFYVPAKTGADVETQIYPGDLFDFDMEVQPILEVLVGKTIEQALVEVLEEEELAALREQQRKFLEIRAAETAEALRLQEREKRLVAEKERRLTEHEEGLRLQKEMEERIAAAVLMQGYMANLLPSVLEGLEEEGFMIDNIKQDIDESFMPWLVREVTHELQDMVSSRDILTDIVREILENRAEIYKALGKEPDDEAEEEGPSMEDIILQDHLKLQQEIAKKGTDAQTTEATSPKKET